MKKVFLISSSLFLFAAVASAQSVIEPTDTEARVTVYTKKMDGTPRAGESIVFLDNETEEKITFDTNEEGKYILLLPEGHSFKVFSTVLNNTQEISKLDIPEHPGELAFKMTLQWDLSKRELRLDDIHFDTGKSTLRSSSMPILEDLYNYLEKNPTMTIEIQGHTDDRGSDESNLTLSNNRAKAVFDFLVKNGIEAKRLQSKGYGESNPIADNGTEKGRQENRRTVVKILTE